MFARQGYGQRAAREAVLLAAERARQYGVCVYTLRRASHIGRVGTCAASPPGRVTELPPSIAVGETAILLPPHSPV